MLDTRVGTVELQIPKLRQGAYFPSLLEPGRRHEQALLAVVNAARMKQATGYHGMRIPAGQNSMSISSWRGG